ncbi:hypothetical protein B0T11DRAFT_360067, partial [Plectosphaerella cucumerina]
SCVGRHILPGRGEDGCQRRSGSSRAPDGCWRRVVADAASVSLPLLLLSSSAASVAAAGLKRMALHVRGRHEPGPPWLACGVRESARCRKGTRPARSPGTPQCEDGKRSAEQPQRQLGGHTQWTRLDSNTWAGAGRTASTQYDAGGYGNCPAADRTV